MKSLLVTALALGFVGVAAGAASAQDQTALSVSRDQAKRMVAACEAYGKQNKLRFAIWVVDANGLPVALKRMEDAEGEVQSIAVDTALMKAKSAIRGQGVTSSFVGMAGTPYGQNLLEELKLFPVQGGVPIVQNGKIIGAVGVGGNNKDEECAQLAVAAGVGG